MTDKQAMRRTIELAERGTGYVSPNPRVGALLVQEGEIIGEAGITNTATFTLR